MQDIGLNKKQQITNIIVIVKVVALLLCGIILFKHIFSPSQVQVDFLWGIEPFAATVSATLILVGIYGSWIVSINRVTRTKHIERLIIGENIFFIGIFTMMILISGGYDSPYKFLYLFIITLITIQFGMAQGMLTATLSSLIVLGIDLLTYKSGVVNLYFENDLILAGVFLLTAGPLGYYVKLEREHIKKLEGLVNYDSLTGVYNHKYFQQTLKGLVTKAKEEDRKISLMFIDIDYFKYYNDLNGHQKGDYVLSEIGRILRENIRAQDCVARYGGEEFAIILPDTDQQEVLLYAEEIRCKVEMAHIEGQENQPQGNLTVSIGVSTYPDNARDEVELLKSADDALYRAKFFNKNRVEIYTSVIDEIKKDLESEHLDLITSMKTLISVINAKDRYTYAHSERAVLYSRLLAKELGLNDEDKNNLIYGAYLHDIGKINIEEAILNKKMPLTQQEWEILKSHPKQGAEMISHVDSLRPILPIIYYHHEKYDGTGYPIGKKGEEIPYLARIMTVVDCFDAMTSNRPYNKRKSYEEGIEELKRWSGIQFDPEIVEVFAKVIVEHKNDLHT